MYLHIYMCIYRRIHTYRYTYVYVYMYMYIYISCIYKYIMYIYMKHVYTYIYIHVRDLAPSIKTDWVLRISRSVGFHRESDSTQHVLSKCDRISGHKIGHKGNHNFGPNFDEYSIPDRLPGLKSFFGLSSHSVSFQLRPWAFR